MTKRKVCMQNKIATVMREYDSRRLKTHDKIVKSKKQALAIAYSEARNHCKKG